MTEDFKVDYKNGMLIDSLPGVSVQVLMEFPGNDRTKSLYFIASDIISVSHSSARTKHPVTMLGQVSASGIALGTRMVAGSIIKLFHRSDSLNHYIKTFVDARFEQLSESGNFTFDDVESNISFKEFSDYLADDISPFNIHLIHLSEPAYNASTDWSSEWKPAPPRVTSIIGCTIINNGKVFSVENLVTEETLSFLAKTVIYSTDNLHPEKAATGIITGSALLGIRDTDEEGTDILANYREFAQGFTQSAGYATRNLLDFDSNGNVTINTSSNSSSAGGVTTTPSTTTVSNVSTYTIVKGDTLSGIAKKFGVTSQNLVEWNKIANANKISAGQTIIVSDPTKAKTVEEKDKVATVTSATDTAQPVTPAEQLANVPATDKADETYKVVKGDTLSGIAKKKGLKWQDIATLNNIKSPYVIRIGQILKLK